MTTTADAKADEAFLTFHRKNPQVYANFVRFAREAKASRNSNKIGAKAVWERMRWEAHIVIQGSLAYDLNNNFVSRYARLAMMQEPDLAGFFETRKLKRKEIPQIPSPTQSPKEKTDGA